MLYDHRNATLDTDLYELTMVAGYRWHHVSDKKACFELFFRAIPDHGGFCLFAGLEAAIDFVNNLKLEREDIEFLQNSGAFSAKALTTLQPGLRFSGDIWSVPEGTIVFPGEPLLRVVAPIDEAQLLETALLTNIGHQTLIATKAARLFNVAGGASLIEFGSRRAHGVEAALCGARAAYIGGCSATSNVNAGRLFGIPLRGTQSHSWIESFPTEQEAFEKFSDLFAEQTVLLVDTFHILNGLRTAIAVGQKLRQNGGKLAGIRIDSGDLAYWSKSARTMLDEAGLFDTKILASGDLDEWIVESLVQQQAPIDAFCVGTRLITAFSCPALGAVYKLTAITDTNGSSTPKMKISENPAKITTPGIKKIVRFYNKDGYMIGDLLLEETESLSHDEPITAYHPMYTHLKKIYYPPVTTQELLVPIFQAGKQVYKIPPLSAVRELAMTELSRLEPEYKRLRNAHIYKVSLSAKLFSIKQNIINNYRHVNSDDVDNVMSGGDI